ncbi:MAG: hypothetical protein OEW21_01560 [Betaproteobacteria bacterium]|nr:hypothetical protein [Betaproteobacteria bacterium]
MKIDANTSHRGISNTLIAKPLLTSLASAGPDFETKLDPDANAVVRPPLGAVKYGKD